MFTGGPDSGTEITESRRLTQEENVANEDRLRELEEKYEDYKVYDNQGERIGKVDDLFVDETDREEYIGVKMGFLGLKSTLIPMDIVRVNEGERSMEVSESKDHVKNAPSFDDDEDITPAYEDRIRSYFNLESLESSGGAYGAYSGSRETTKQTTIPQVTRTVLPQNPRSTGTARNRPQAKTARTSRSTGV
jgi:sporulation protein YlmC with PRC-barrel domain